MIIESSLNVTVPDVPVRVSPFNGRKILKALEKIHTRGRVERNCRNGYS
jgi:hypothetical protein